VTLMALRILKRTLVLVASLDSVAFALTEAELREGDQLIQTGAYSQAEALYRTALERDSE